MARGFPDVGEVSAVLNENSLCLSRTRKGVSDTSTSSRKQPLRLVGEELRRQSAGNEKRVHQFVCEARNSPPPRSAKEVRDLLFTIADMTNEGLLPAGRLRTWPIGANQKAPQSGQAVSGAQAKVEPERIEAGLEEFCEVVHRRWGELESDPVPLASWAEWELNGGSLHPFYDGCGRIARSFGAMLLVRGGCLPPLYDNSESYFAHGGQGSAAFAAYVRQCIERCKEWVGTASGADSSATA